MSDKTESENRFTDLITFVREQIREFIIPITKDTLIEDDLGVTGDEADELITYFSKHYKVNITNFDFSKYFYDEPGVFNVQNRIVKPLTIGHLEKAILAGRLDDEVING